MVTWSVAAFMLQLSCGEGAKSALKLLFCKKGFTAGINFYK